MEHSYQPVVILKCSIVASCTSASGTLLLSTLLQLPLSCCWVYNFAYILLYINTTQMYTTDSLNWSGPLLVFCLEFMLYCTLLPFSSFHFWLNHLFPCSWVFLVSSEHNLAFVSSGVCMQSTDIANKLRIFGKFEEKQWHSCITLWNPLLNEEQRTLYECTMMPLTFIEDPLNIPAMSIAHHPWHLIKN